MTKLLNIVFLIKNPNLNSKLGSDQSTQSILSYIIGKSIEMHILFWVREPVSLISIRLTQTLQANTWRMNHPQINNFWANLLIFIHGLHLCKVTIHKLRSNR